jgi:hypothetical protein
MPPSDQGGLVSSKSWCGPGEHHKDSKVHVHHGLINYIDTKAKCRHKKLTCKGTLRQVFIRVYKLVEQSVMWVFLTQLCELLPLYNLVFGSTLALSPLPCVNKYTVYAYTVCKGRGVLGSGSLDR